MKTRTVAAATLAGALVAGVLVARRRTSTIGGPRPADLEVPDGTTLTVTTDDGADLPVWVVGEGPTVVLPHCWMGGPAVWAPVAHRLVRAGRQVVLYDQRGHGGATIGADGLTMERLGLDLDAVLDAVDAEGAVLAGHSMGGMTIQSFAAERPEAFASRIDAVVLVSTASANDPRAVRQGMLQAKVLGHPLFDTAMRRPAGVKLVGGAFGPAASQPVREITRDLCLACPPAVRRTWLEAILAMDLRPGLATIDVPTHILVGSRDSLTPVARAEELRDLITGSTLRVLPNHGHMLPLEAPDEVADAILTVLQERVPV
jgi:non-heme chloroperoxidase